MINFPIKPAKSHIKYTFPKNIADQKEGKK